MVGYVLVRPVGCPSQLSLVGSECLECANGPNTPTIRSGFSDIFAAGGKVMAKSTVTWRGWLKIGVVDGI